MHTRAPLRITSPWSPALASLALALSACSSTEQSVEAAPGGVIVEQPEALEAGGDRSVERSLATVLRSSNVQDGRRVLELELFNTGAAILDFIYTIEWLDRGGEVLEAPGTPWRRLTLEPGSSVSLRVTAPGPGAESWRLRAMAPPR